MKDFDVIVVGSGSGTTIVDGALRSGFSVALVEKDELGGTCLNRGCIPSKMVIYPADLVALLGQVDKLGLQVKIEDIDFPGIMKRTRDSIRRDRQHMEEGISEIDDLEYYHDAGEFIEDYTMKVGSETIKAKYIFLVSGSRPLIPPIKGLDNVEYLTNRNVWDLDERPDSMTIVGGGLISVEMAHFFSAMGTDVTILSRSPRLLKYAEPEISRTLMRSMRERMGVVTNAEVAEVTAEGTRISSLANVKDEGLQTYESESLFIATGRRGNADLLNVEETGVEADGRGFIKVNEYFETSKDRIWAFGDAIGKAMFKHVANTEAELVWHAFSHGHKESLDYDKVPYAVYGWPQVASVGLTQKKAEESDLDILVGHYKYSNTAKGEAMGEENGFVKVVVEEDTYRILGAHIVGPHAPILIQEVITVMHYGDGSIAPIYRAMHIHPALPEVVQWAFGNLHKPGKSSAH